jgi:RimJ/RimL family protein N-acetyltransferase
VLSLRTARLVLEPLTVAHAPAMFDVLRDPLIYTYLDFGPPTSLAHLQRVYAALERRASPDGTEEWLNWIVVLDGAPIGVVQATISAGGCEVAYILHSAHWGRGYALEAMTAMLAHLGERAFFANVEETNARSIRLLERLGFREIASRGTARRFTAAR